MGMNTCSHIQKDSLITWPPGFYPGKNERAAYFSSGSVVVEELHELEVCFWKSTLQNYCQATEEHFASLHSTIHILTILLFIFTGLSGQLPASWAGQFLKPAPKAKMTYAP